MIKFTDICLIVLSNAILWHVIFFCLTNDSRLQKYRLRKSLDNILRDLAVQAEGGAKHPELDIIHKNRKFVIKVTLKEVNKHYSAYYIFINGEEAAIYHRLKHWCFSSYFLEEVNRRHKHEVISIIHAGNRVLKKLAKPKKVKVGSYNEYSYFN